ITFVGSAGCGSTNVFVPVALVFPEKKPAVVSVQPNDPKDATVLVNPEVLIPRTPSKSPMPTTGTSFEPPFPSTPEATVGVPVHQLAEFPLMPALPPSVLALAPTTTPPAETFPLTVNWSPTSNWLKKYPTRSMTRWVPTLVKT